MMTTLLLVFALYAQAAAEAVYPTGVPRYSESFIPAAAQVVYHVIEHTEYFKHYSQRTAMQSPHSFETPLIISDENLHEEGRKSTNATPMQKQLLTLHNSLIREAKLQGLAKYQGFSEEVMSVLRDTSNTTSVEQLKIVLQEALSRDHIQRADTKDTANKVLTDLDEAESDLCKAMANLKPVQYV